MVFFKTIFKVCFPWVVYDKRSTFAIIKNFFRSLIQVNALFALQEYVDIHYVYVFCDGNAKAALESIGNDSLMEQSILISNFWQCAQALLPGDYVRRERLCRDMLDRNRKVITEYAA